QSIIVGGITDNTSTLIIDLPVGLELVPNSLSCSSEVCLTLISSILQSNSKTLLTFRIPSGIDAGSIIQFQIDVKYNRFASCGINTIDLRTEDQLTGISCPSAPGGVCKSLRVETGIGSTTININKPALTFTSLTGNVTSTQGELETYNVDFALNNVGTANLLAANPLTIDFYCADGSGNAKGSILSTYTNAINLTSGNTFTSSYTFKAIGNSLAGELVAVVSAGSNCICSQVLQKYHANVIPLANDDNAITHEGIPVTFNIIVNDIDADGAIDPSTIDLDTMTPGKQTNRIIAEQGTFAINTSTGDLTFSPLPNFVGAVTPISYQVCDNGANSMCGQANITVTVLNNAPIANNDVITTLEDTPVSGSVTENDISNGTSNNTWSLTGAQGGCEHGIVSMNSDGNFTYSPDANYFGLDSFSYKLCDVSGDCSQATVTITVNPVNDPPEAIADNFETKENQQLGGNILSNDSDNEGDQLILNVNPLQNTSNGALILTASGDFIYKPIIDFIGTDSFIYQICDNGTPSLCSTATVTILVTKDESCEVFVPNSFSPDGDGIHDNFKIRCLYNYENPIIEIYNRWGNLVYEKDHYGNVDYWGSEEDAWWNGRSDHKMNIGNAVLPVGTYYYVLKLNSIKVLTGFLFLNK
ncbi:MAG TPA: Ig-like domain-containing protein, partial [Prolixibacteraceae bacterium]